MEIGDKYEYNSRTREQYILEVKLVLKGTVLFNAKSKEGSGNWSNVEVKKTRLNKMIKENKIRLLDPSEWV